MARPTSEDRREDYLDIGMEILSSFTADVAADASIDALADVKVADVAERAGVTKGAIYHIWPSQAAYRKDLLARLIEQSSHLGLRDLAALVEQSKKEGRDPTVLMRAACDYAFDQLKDDIAFFARFSFFNYATNPEVNELFVRGDQELVKQFGETVELYLELKGRRIRDVFTKDTVVNTAGALLTGLCLRYRTSPTLVETAPKTESNRRAASLYGEALDAILMHFSEPIRPADS